jgi:hypothetical protein
LDTLESITSGVTLTPYYTPNYPQKVAYHHYRHMPLYDAKSSGGLENLVNYQEDWTGSTVKFSGVLTAPWDAQELKKTDQSPAYYDISYYKAPTRFYDYYEEFLNKQPPGTPSLYSVKRKAFKELDAFG